MTLEPAQFFFSENVNIYLQSLGTPFLDILFKAVSNVFSEPVYIFLASLIFWCYNKKTGIRVMYVVLFSAFTAILTKNLFGMPRPPEYLHKIEENGSGFPSGHALLSSSFWGYIGYRTKDRLIVVAGILVILSVSLSRIYLGVHYAGDIVGGIIFGLLAALVFVKAESGIANRLEKLDRSSKYIVAVSIPVIMLILAFMQRGLMKEQVEIGLVMGGIGIGYLLEEERVRFADAGNNKQRIRRAVIGTVVVGIIYLITSMLLLVNPGFVFLKYSSLGFASTFIVPWVFTRMEV